MNKKEDKKSENILETANRLIYGDRNKTYSHPTENFTNIANLHNAYLEAISRRPGVLQNIHTGKDKLETTVLRINELDVAYMMILTKVARGATNQAHLDTIVDIAGYAGCAERIIKNK